MRTVRYTVKGLPEDLYKQCLRYNMWGQGDMRYRLKLYRELDIKAHVIAIIQDKDSRELLAWGLIFPRVKNHTPTAYYYVRKEHRRKGLGAKLMAATIVQFKEVWVEPWDDRSNNFFKSMPYYSRSNHCIKMKRKENVS